QLTLTGTPGTNTVEWQVVQYTGASVQTGDLTMAAGTASATAALTSVTTTKTWLVYNYRSEDGTATDMGQKLMRGRITSATQLTFDRNNTGTQIDLTWYAVEFTDGTTVQGGTQAFTTAETQKNVT